MQLSEFLIGKQLLKSIFNNIKLTAVIDVQSN